MPGLDFSSGIPFLLVYVTQSVWLSGAKVPIELLGLMSELTLAGVASGFVIECLGFEWFFVATSLIGVPVAVSCWYVWRLQQRTRPQPAV